MVDHQEIQHLTSDLTITFFLLTGCHWSSWQHRGAGFDWPESESSMFSFFKVSMSLSAVDLFSQTFKKSSKVDTSQA